MSGLSPEGFHCSAEGEAESGLDLVENEDCLDVGAQLSKGLEEAGLGHDSEGVAGSRLNEDRCRGLVSVVTEVVLQGLDIVEREGPHVAANAFRDPA